MLTDLSLYKCKKFTTENILVTGNRVKLNKGNSFAVYC